MDVNPVKITVLVDEIDDYMRFGLTVSAHGVNKCVATLGVKLEPTEIEGDDGPGDSTSINAMQHSRWY